MRVRRDSVFISAVLFTTALLCTLPMFARNALRSSEIPQQSDLCCGLYYHTVGDLAFASLAIIFAALIVTWSGYAKCLRSAWFVLFVVMSAWAFPLLALPFFKNWHALPFLDILYGAIHGSTYPRIWMKGILIFSLMVIALLLPIKSFFVVRGIREPRWRLSSKLIGFSVAGTLVLAIGLLAWIDFRTYEMPSLQMMMSPPLPPPLSRAPAEDWLSLSADEKYGYVRGYLAGFQGGKRLACSFHADKKAARLPHSLPPESLPQQVCMTSLPYLVETHTNAYVDTITNYYTKYPHDQEAEVSNVLDMMATPPGLTDSDQIHAKLGGDAKRH